MNEGDEAEEQIINDMTNLHPQNAEAKMRIERTLTGRLQEEIENHCSLIVQNASDAIISTTNQGNILLWNRMAEDMFDYSADEIVGKPLTLVISDPFLDVRCGGWQGFASGQAGPDDTRIETIGIRRDGSEIPIELSMSTWKTRDETYFCAIIRNITEHKRMEAKKETAFQLLQNAIDGVNEPIMVIGTDYRVLLMNQAVTNDYPVGTNPTYCYQVSHDRDTPCGGDVHPCPLEEVRKTGRPATVIHEHIRKDGEKRLVEILVAPLLDENDTLTGIVESTRDITERIHAEEALRESERQYRILSAKNYDLAESLRRQNTQRGELLKGLITAQEDERKRVARELHDDLGQALGGLALQVGVVKQLAVSDPDRAIEQLDEIHALIGETTDRMYDLILALRPSLLDDMGLTSALRAYADRLLAGANIAFTLDAAGFSDRLPPEMETALYRVFQEALNNIVRHAGAGQVQMVLTRHHSVFEGEIEDDGQGFDPQAVPLDGHSSHGLGLLGMRERVTQCGGQMEIISQPGKGTRICIQLPLPEEGGYD